LELERLAELFPDSADRDDIVRLAEHAVWGDDKLEGREQRLVEHPVERLRGVPA
jgi:hypothetical protein